MGRVMLFVLVGLVVLLGVEGQTDCDARYSCTLLDPTSIEKYVQELPIPPRAVPRQFGPFPPPNQTIKHFEVIMAPMEHQFHPSLGPATVYAFNNSLPGPLFEVSKDEEIFVTWLNHLGDQHILPVDESLLQESQKNIGVVAVTHLHGIHSVSQFDGLPDDYVRPGESYEAYYNNSQNATLLWYHDHAIGITRLNVYAGLVGPYIIRDSIEDSLHLPSGPYEIPLILQDRTFCENGSLYYPSAVRSLSPDAPCPSIVTNFFGDVIVVNGAIWPKQSVERKTYRFRVVAGTSTRTFILELKDKNNVTHPFTLIGGDGGLLPQPLKMNSLRLMSAERADILIDFSPFSNSEEIFLKNVGPDKPWRDDPLATPADEETTGNVMKFVVVSDQPEKMELNWAGVPDQPSYCSEKIPPENVIPVNIYKTVDEYDRNFHLFDNLTYMDPITYKVPVGEVVVWEFINHTRESHPIHLHQVQFAVCNRESMELGFKTKPYKRETGLKDTVECPPLTITRVAAVFDLAGKFVVHCHNLEHEDHDLMRPFLVA